MSNTDVGWNDDWSVFVNALQQQLKGERNERALADYFGGCEVRWKGLLEQIAFDELAAVVDVALTERVVTLKDGSEVRLDGLTLAVEEKDMDKWYGLTPGDEVTFTATLGAPNSPFSPIELKTLKSGKSLIVIRLSGAVPT